MTIEEGELNDLLLPDLDRPDWKAPLGDAFDRALCYLEGLPDRPVVAPQALQNCAPRSAAQSQKGPLTRPRFAELATAAEPGLERRALVQSGSPLRRSTEFRHTWWCFSFGPLVEVLISPALGHDVLRRVRRCQRRSCLCSGPRSDPGRRWSGRA
jgi:hypothetical protein